MLVRGMEHLDEYTTSALCKLWEANSARSLCEDLTTTVYHIGFSEESGEVTTFAYRSSSNFASERLQHGFAVKPECVVPDGDDILALIEPTMEEQRRTQAKVALEKRIHIGGEAIAMHLTDQGCNTFRLFRFPDYEAQMEHALRSSMRSKFSGNQ